MEDLEALAFHSALNVGRTDAKKPFDAIDGKPTSANFILDSSERIAQVGDISVRPAKIR